MTTFLCDLKPVLPGRLLPDVDDAAAAADGESAAESAAASGDDRLATALVGSSTDGTISDQAGFGRMAESETSRQME